MNMPLFANKIAPYIPPKAARAYSIIATVTLLVKREGVVKAIFPSATCCSNWSTIGCIYPLIASA